MATPGFSIRSSLKREATGWPPSPATATRLLPLLSESVRLEATHEGLFTREKQTSTIITARQSLGSISLSAHYRGLEDYLAMALGFIGPTFPETLDTGVYRHVFEVDPVLSTKTWVAGEGWIAGEGFIAGTNKVRHATYTVNKGQIYWETTGTQFQNMQFNTSPSQCTFTSDVTGYVTTYASASDLDELSLLGEQMLFRECTLYISASAPLTSAHIVADIVGFGFTLQNNLGSIQTRETKKFFAEGKREAPALISGSFALPHYTSVGPQLQVWADQGTRLYGLLEFVGEDINEDYSFRMGFWFPSIKLTDYDIGVQGPEQLQQVFEFVAHSVSETPSGFPDNTKGGPMLVELVNDFDENALID